MKIIPVVAAVPALAIQKLTAHAEGIFAVDHSTRPELDVNKGMHVIVDLCIQKLADTGLVFNRSSILVCVDRNDSIHTFTDSTVKLALSKLYKFVKSTWNPAAEQLIIHPAPIPDYVGKTIVSLTSWSGMPAVDALADHPILTIDNRLLTPGFDPATRVFSRFDPEKFQIPTNPSREDALAALALIRRLLQTFDFEGAEDEAAALAMLFTAVSRAGLSTALIVLIAASMPGSGKGYLAQLACRLAEARTPIARQLQADQIEMHKSIMSALSEMAGVLFFDECETSDIDLPCLRTLATSDVYGGRMLGYIRNIHFPNRAFTVATGNNIAATQDFARRTLNLYLNPKVENPSLRRFGYDCPDPSIKSAAADVKQNRELFISAILTIQRAFLLAQQRGEVEETPLTLGGFDTWEALCRLPVLWLTGVDPAAKSIEAMKENSAKDELSAILAAWGDAFGAEPTTPTQACRHPDFYDALTENMKRRPGSQVNNITLALWLKKHRQQIAGGRMFIKGEKDSHTKAWFWTIDEVGK